MPWIYFDRHEEDCFLPTDRLSAVVDDDSYDFSSCELIENLMERFGVPETAISKAMTTDATMQVLIECVVADR